MRADPQILGGRAPAVPVANNSRRHRTEAITCRDRGRAVRSTVSSAPGDVFVTSEWQRLHLSPAEADALGRALQNAAARARGDRS